MNSEELELSLRTEFESYLKGVLAGMQQDVADFQKNFEAEFEKHKAQMDEGFRNLSSRFDSDANFDRAFTESVVEHLRLARDDGAKLSAEAFSNAQRLDESSAPAQYDRLRDAINDISSQTTQSSILKSLVDHASSFISRGAFFLVKNDSLVCWRRFDGMGSSDDESVRAIQFSVDADTLLAESVRSLRTKDSSLESHADDSVYLDQLGFGMPDRMYAFPLIARGRGVAVLYADHGGSSDPVSLEAIESLVRVAGLTVELRAATSAAVQPAPVETPAYVPTQSEESSAPSFATGDSYTAYSPADSYKEVPAVEPAPAETQAEEVEEVYTASEAPAAEEYTGEVSVEYAEAEVEAEPAVETGETVDNTATYGFEPVAVENEPVVAEPEYEQVEVAEPQYEQPVNDFAFSSSDTYDASAEPEVEEAAAPDEEYAYAAETKNGTNGHSFETAPEPVVEVGTPQTTKSRLSDRHVDLPIEVSEDERRLHNDARRFARLLVSEIKLYNEQKVNEGRDVGDLYDRLREAIDRSREMYDKRVQPQVAAKFDYFHYELVSNLAQGNDAKLGASYPGAAV